MGRSISPWKSAGLPTGVRCPVAADDREFEHVERVARRAAVLEAEDVDERQARGTAATLAEALNDASIEVNSMSMIPTDRAAPTIRAKKDEPSMPQIEPSESSPLFVSRETQAAAVFVHGRSRMRCVCVLRVRLLSDRHRRAAQAERGVEGFEDGRCARDDEAADDGHLAFLGATAADRHAPAGDDDDPEQKADLHDRAQRARSAGVKVGAARLGEHEPEVKQPRRRTWAQRWSKNVAVEVLRYGKEQECFAWPPPLRTLRVERQRIHPLPYTN